MSLLNPLWPEWKRKRNLAVLRRHQIRLQFYLAYTASHFAPFLLPFFSLQVFCIG